MKTGKCPESVLKRSVYRQLNKRRTDVICRPGTGHGGAAVLLPGSENMQAKDGQIQQRQFLVTHTACFCGTPEEAARGAVHSAATALLVKHATPVGIEMSVLMPLDFEEADLRRLMKLADEACAVYDMEVLGGHTATVASVTVLTVTVTVFGFSEAEAEIRPESGIRPKAGDDIVMTGYAGLYGTAVLAASGGEALKARYYPDFIDETKNYLADLSVKRDIEIARQFDTSVIYGIAKGGIFGALWEVAVAGKVGLLVHLKKIPLKQQTVEICNFYDVNPYKLESSGALLIGTLHGEHLVAALAQAGISGAVIGQFTDSNDKIVVSDDEIRYLEPPRGSGLEEKWMDIVHMNKNMADEKISGKNS